MRLMWLHPQGLEFQFDLERWHRHRRFRRNVHCSLLVRAVCTSTLACSSSSWLAASWTALPLDGHVGMTPCEVSFLSFLFPTLVYVATTALYFFGFNLPPWNYRKVIWWCVTWASIDNNASTEMGETSQKAERFVCHIHTELFFLFKWVKHNNRNTLVFRLNVTLFTELWAISFHCFRLSLNMSLTFANNKNVCIV